MIRLICLLLGFLGAHIFGAVAFADSPPAVSIANQPDGAVIPGLLAIVADASDDVRVDVVYLLIDDEVAARDAVAPYTMQWDFSELTPGPHRISAIAVDSLGQRTSASITVTVPPPLPT